MDNKKNSNKGVNNIPPRVDNDQLGENAYEKFVKNDCKNKKTSK